MLATLGAEKGILVATRPPGERAMFIVNQAGEFPFHCTVHPNMRGTLRVMLNGQPSPGTSPSPSPSPTEPLNQ